MLAVAVLPACLFSCRSAPEPRRETPAWQLPAVVSALQPVSDPLRLVPASSRVVVQVRRPAAFLDDDNDPVTQEIWRLLDRTVPRDTWQSTAARVGLDRKILLRNLFGSEMLLVDMDYDDRRRAIVITRSSNDLLTRLPVAAEWQPWPEQPTLGPWQLFRGESTEGVYAVALAEERLALTSQSGFDHLRHLLTATASGDPPLVDDPAYRELTRHLPPDGEAYVFARDRDGGEAHAVQLGYSETGVFAHYAAQTTNSAQFRKPLAAVPRVEFGPLPDVVSVAATVSLLVPEVPGESSINLLMFPGSFRRDILENIEPPLLGFFGSLPRQRFAPDPGFTIPVAGLAVRVKSADATHALDRLLGRLHFFLAISRFDLVEGFFGQDRIERDGLVYHVADFGDIARAAGGDGLMAQLAALPESDLVTRLAYGQIGDYYVICSNQKFFDSWQRAQNTPAARLSRAGDLRDFQLTDRDGLIASVIVRGERLSALLDEVGEFLVQRLAEDGEGPVGNGAVYQADIDRSDIDRRNIGPGDSETASTEAGNSESLDAEADEESTPTTASSDGDAPEVEGPLRWIERGFENRRAVSLQLWCEHDGLLEGRLRALSYERE